MRHTASPGERLTFLAAMVTAALGAVGLLLSPVVIEAVKNDAPPADCLKILKDYRSEVRASPEQYEIVMPGADGESYVLRDPNAIACDIKPQDLEP